MMFKIGTRITLTVDTLLEKNMNLMSLVEYELKHNDVLYEGFRSELNQAVKSHFFPDKVDDMTRFNEFNDFVSRLDSLEKYLFFDRENTHIDTCSSQECIMEVVVAVDASLMIKDFEISKGMITLKDIIWIVETDTDEEYATAINAHGLPTELSVDSINFCDEKGNYSKEDITMYLNREFGFCPDDFEYPPPHSRDFSHE